MSRLLRLDTALKVSQHPICPRAVTQTEHWRIAVYRDYYVSPYVFTAYVSEYNTDGKVITTYKLGSSTLFGLKAVLRHNNLPIDGAVWRTLDTIYY